MPFVLCVIIGANKFRQITFISYSPVIQIKLYITVYLDSKMIVKFQRFQLSKNK